MSDEKPVELFAIEKEITIRQLEGGIITMLVDGAREIVSDIAAAQFRVGEILGLEANRGKGSRANMSNDEAIVRLQELYAPGSDIALSMITKLPGIGEHRAGVIVERMTAEGLLSADESGALRMAMNEELRTID